MKNSTTAFDNSFVARISVFTTVFIVMLCMFHFSGLPMWILAIDIAIALLLFRIFFDEKTEIENSVNFYESMTDQQIEFFSMLFFVIILPTVISLFLNFVSRDSSVWEWFLSFFFILFANCIFLFLGEVFLKKEENIFVFIAQSGKNIIYEHRSRAEKRKNYHYEPLRNLQEYEIEEIGIGFATS